MNEDLRFARAMNTDPLTDLTLVDRLHAHATLWTAKTVRALREEAAARIADLEGERLVLHDKINELSRELGGERIEAAARIAELEGERDRLAERVRHAEAEADRPNASAWLAARTAELKAERDRLAEKVRQNEADLEDPTLSVGEAYADRSANHGPAKKPPR